MYDNICAQGSINLRMACTACIVWQSIFVSTLAKAFRLHASQLELDRFKRNTILYY